MVRSKIRYEFIADERNGRETFKKRRMGIFKKLNELKTLCDVEACGIITNSDWTQTEVWPSENEASQVIEKFTNLPPSSSAHTNSKVDQIGFLKQNLTRVTKNVDKEIRKVRTLEKELLLAECVAKEEANLSNSLQLHEMLRLLDEKIGMVDSRLAIAGVGTSSPDIVASAEELKKRRLRGKGKMPMVL